MSLLSKLGFKSKPEKALEARMAVRRTVQGLKKLDASLNRKKDEMIKHAQEAKKQGVKQQYALAANGLKMVLTQQKRARAMVLQMQIAESMRDLTTMNTQFVGTLGNVGKELEDLVRNANFAQNQMDFEKGMMRADDAMQQLESFLEDTGMQMEEMTDDEMNDEVAKLIDATGAAEVAPEDDEINAMLNKLNAKKDAIKE